MKPTDLTLEAALLQAQTMPFAYMASFSSVTIGRTPGQPDLSEVLEARFFGPDGEIRIYRDGEALRATAYMDRPEDIYMDCTSETISPRFGKSITKRRYVEFDEDGQAKIAATRLLDWKEA